MEKEKKWTFYRDAAKQWRWRCQAGGNYETLCYSEDYHNKLDCWKTALQMGCPLAFADVVWHRSDPRKKRNPKTATP